MCDRLCRDRTTTPSPRRPLTRVLAVAATATVLLATALADGAAVHGSTIDPPSRNYRCWKVCGNDSQNPAMATQNPMCWHARQADPNAMWNWNGAQPVSNTFTVKVHDLALHGADFYRVYVTRPGDDPLTQPLRWADLELRADTGRIAPGVGTRESDPVLSGVTTSIQVSAPGRTGRHAVFVNWKASHADQTYYWCSDVIFPGGPTGSPSASPPASPTSPSASPTPGTGGCSATYSGATVAARNVSYNGNLAAGASTSFGFIGVWNGTNSVPGPTCTAS
ncbi:MAG: lytic polysaccharide monooxygenase [Micromonosporaceae bacterium]|nr:lytic polysaccharide monooxygenase [Micromonosporaceae bacterium]